MSLSPSSNVVRAVGRYALIRRLGADHVAEIYLAQHARKSGDDRHVIVKRMLPQIARDGGRVEQFLTEARLAAQLDHPNIVRIEKIDVDADSYYYAMEYVRGADLRQILRGLAHHNRVASIECALAIGVALCAALEHAHTKHAALVHRHVTPSKVLLSDAGAIKLGGFGAIEDLLACTAGYQAPEQCVGSAVDRRSDLFSLGAVLYELTTGVPPFTGPTDAEAIADTAWCKITPPSQHRADYPTMLETIVLRALRRDPDDRHQTAGELQRDLEAVQRTLGVAASPRCIAALVASAGHVASPPRSIEMGEQARQVEDAGDAAPRASTSQSMSLASSSIVITQIARWHHRWWAVLVAGMILAGLGISVIAVYRMQYAPAPPLYVGRPAPPEMPPSSRPPVAKQRAADAPEPTTAPDRRPAAKRPASEQPAKAQPAPPIAPVAGPSAQPAPPPKTMSDAAPTITSIDVRGLPTPMVRKSVESAIPALRACFKAAARERGLATNSTINLLFDIDDSRAAVNVRTNRDRAMGSLPGCVTMAIGKIRTPQAPSPGTAHVYLTITFRPI